MFAYTLQGVSLANNVISVKNNVAIGADLQLDLAFVMRSGRIEKMFSPEDIKTLTDITGVCIDSGNDVTSGNEQNISLSSKAKLKLVA